MERYDKMAQFDTEKERDILNGILERYGLVVEFIEGSGDNDSPAKHVEIRRNDKWRKMGYKAGWTSGFHLSWEGCMEDVSQRLSRGILYPVGKKDNAANAMCVSWEILRLPTFKTPTELMMKLELRGEYD